MITRSLRDLENIRINDILQRLISMRDQSEAALNDELKGLALNASVLKTMFALELVDHLKKLHFDAANMELFADYLVSQNTSSSIENAKVLYQQIQTDNIVFSVVIQNKLMDLN